MTTDLHLEAAAVVVAATRRSTSKVHKQQIVNKRRSAVSATHATQHSTARDALTSAITAARSATQTLVSISDLASAVCLKRCATKRCPYITSSLSSSGTRRINSGSTMSSSSRFVLVAALLVVCCSHVSISSAYLYQPLNYLLMPPDDGQTGASSGALFADDATSGAIAADQADANQMDGHATSSGGDADVASIISAGIERWRNAKMVEQQQQQQDNDDNNNGKSEGGVASAVTHMLLSGLTDLAAQSSSGDASPVASSSQIDTIDTSGDGADSSGVASSISSSASKADIKSGPGALRLYYSPKDTMQALRISAMATPSRHKKVYFRAEKKLDIKDDNKSIIKPLSVSRRSSRAAASASAPGIFDKGVVDFMRRLRDVYIQTRPAGGSSVGGISVASLASPVANTFASLAAASASGSSSSSSASPSSASSSTSSGSSGMSSALSSAANVLQTAASNASGSSADGLSSGGSRPNRSPISTQSYVSFWSKTFPDWVRKMLKQLRRRSLQYRRQQQLQQQQQSSSIAQASGSGHSNSGHSSSH